MVLAALTVGSAFAGLGAAVPAPRSPATQHVRRSEGHPLRRRPPWGLRTNDVALSAAAQRILELTQSLHHDGVPLGAIHLPDLAAESDVPNGNRQFSLLGGTGADGRGRSWRPQRVGGPARVHDVHVQRDGADHAQQRQFDVHLTGTAPTCSASSSTRCWTMSQDLRQLELPVLDPELRELHPELGMAHLWGQRVELLESGPGTCHRTRSTPTARTGRSRTPLSITPRARRSRSATRSRSAFYNNATLIGGRSSLFFNYTVSNATLFHSGSIRLRHVQLEPDASQCGPPGPLRSRSRAQRTDPIGLVNDIELDVVGNDDGDTAVFTAVNATLSIASWSSTSGSYLPVPSAFNAGTDPVRQAPASPSSGIARRRSRACCPDRPSSRACGTSQGTSGEREIQLLGDPRECVRLRKPRHDFQRKSCPMVAINDEPDEPLRAERWNVRPRGGAEQLRPRE